jgi:hypothetical protein
MRVICGSPMWIQLTVRDRLNGKEEKVWELMRFLYL